MDKNQQTILELQAKVYEVIKGQYSALDQLVKRMQDDDKGVVPFKQVESERLALAFALDYFDDIEEQIKQLQIKQTQTAEEEHRKEVDETTDMITAEDVVEQAVYMANAPDCCADEHAENMLGMLGANIVDTEIYHDEDECPRRDIDTIDYKKAVIESVETEFAQFESEMIDGKTAEDVFANNYQIYVKSQIMHTICEEMEFDSEVYMALYEDRGSILKNLHEEFIGQPQASVNSRGDVAELIEEYCNTYHSEIMNEASPLALKM